MAFMPARRSSLLTFDGSLDPGRAQATTNYRITDRSGRIIRVTRAVYDRQTNQVELHLAQRLCLNRYYTLTAFGVPPVGLTGSTGIPLDGTGKNQPGTNFVTGIGWWSSGRTRENVGRLLRRWDTALVHRPNVQLPGRDPPCLGAQAALSQRPLSLWNV